MGRRALTLTVVDASIIVAALEPDDAHHETASAALMDHAAEGEVMLPASAYAEALVHPLQAGPEGAAAVDAFLDRAAVVVVDVDAPSARAAAELRAVHRIRLADALVLGVAASHRADVVLTADRAWASLSDKVRVV